LREIIRDKLQRSTSPDPHAVVDPVLKLLGAREVIEAARYGLHTIAVEEVRRSRQRTMAGAPAPPPAPSTKWPAAAQAARARPDIFAQRVQTGSGKDDWRFLGDCDREDLGRAAGLQDGLATAAAARSAQYMTLRKKLHGQAKVKSLPRATVEAVFA
jgi:hypothetical protein